MQSHLVFLRLKCLHAAAAFVAAALASSCSVTPPPPPHCDGSDRHAVNVPDSKAAMAAPSKSCPASMPGALGSRDTG